jgi:hypothetical protein
VSRLHGERRKLRWRRKFNRRRIIHGRRQLRRRIVRRRFVRGPEFPGRQQLLAALRQQFILQRGPGVPSRQMRQRPGLRERPVLRYGGMHGGRICATRTRRMRTAPRHAGGLVQ